MAGMMLHHQTTARNFAFSPKKPNGAVKAERRLYCDIMNLHLEAAGHPARLHPDTLVDRGIAYRPPEPRLSIKDSNALKFDHVRTPRMQQVLQHRADRAPHVEAEHAQARKAWEQRKGALGITRDTPLAERLARIRDAREHAISHAPMRPTLAQLREQERALAQSVTGLERHVQDLQRYGRREQRLEQRREAREWRQELAAERVLVAGKAHGLPRDRQAEQMVARLERTVHAQEAVQQLRGLVHALEHDAPVAGSALRVRLFEREDAREREQDRGRGW
jgi:hypothetical protein